MNEASLSDPQKRPYRMSIFLVLINKHQRPLPVRPLHGISGHDTYRLGRNIAVRGKSVCLPFLAAPTPG